MAIKTVLESAHVEAASAEWGLGRVQSFRGLPEGSINTLYVLDTDRGTHVLRLSEGRTRPEVDFETALLAHLEAERFPAVRLVHRQDGALYGMVRERHACVFVWASGEHYAPSRLTHDQGLELGRVLARLHLATETFDGSLPNRYAPRQIQTWVSELLALPAPDASLAAALPFIAQESARLDTLSPTAEGIIHADLFPDNVKWIGDRISSVLDFEMACRGPYVLDLATCLLAFGWEENGFSVARLRSIVEGYLSERRLSEPERAAFWHWTRFAALRFTVTRIRDFHLSPLDDDQLVKKDWRRFNARLERVVALGDAGWRELCSL